MFKDSLVILQKELKRIFTDRRMLVMLVIVPMVMLPVMYSIMAKVSKTRSADIAEYTSQIYIHTGTQSSSEIIDKFTEGLQELNAKITRVPKSQIENIKQLVKEKEVQLLIVFPDNISENLQQYDPFDIRVYYNSISDYSEHAYSSVKEKFNEISKNVVQDRIVKENLPDNILTPFTINRTVKPSEVNLAEKGSMIGKVMGILLPFFILIYLFANSMKVGLDTVAGEKERGTLAILLVNQVDRLAIVIGKMFSVIIAAFVGAASSVVGLIIASRFFISMFGASSTDVGSYAMHSQTILQFAIVVLPLALLLVSLVMLVSTYAKNPKEGQGMIMPVYIVVMIMGISTMQIGDVPPQWMRIAPVFNSLIALKGVFMQNETWANVLQALLVNLVVSGILIYIILKMFRDEKILFKI
ncbi:MAG: ABC transporter permease [Candidatus Cloacimonetes bacterium]|nr:ABC transporter permease [Candidatus Cloacimonadota bacterium]MBS3768200.1 ABC transporter permease [Candidatus Cloacimonadota bacterium]